MKGEMQDKPKDASDTSSAETADSTKILSLREVRESRELSIDEVAHDLHLSREIVLALEEGDYESLGAAVFVRGHLRSYARLLELPEDEVLAGFKVSEPPPEEFRTLSAPSVVPLAFTQSPSMIILMPSLSKSKSVSLFF